MGIVISSLLEKSPLDLLTSLGGPFLSSMIVYWFMAKLLPNRLNNCLLIALSLIYSLWFNLRSPDLFGTAYHYGMTIFINLWTPFILLLFYRGRFWRRVVVYWYFDIVKAISEAIAFVPGMMYHRGLGIRYGWSKIPSFMEADSSLRLVYTLTFIALFLLSANVSLRMWRRILLHRFQAFYLLFIALPMGQMFSLSLVIRPNMGNPLFGVLLNFTSDVEALYAILALFGALLCLMACLALLVYTIAQEKRSELSREIERARHQMELEQARYRELEARRLELEKLRHDFNNQLASITQLARSGEGSAARELMEALREEIDRSEAHR